MEGILLRKEQPITVVVFVTNSVNSVKRIARPALATKAKCISGRVARTLKPNFLSNLKDPSFQLIFGGSIKETYKNSVKEAVINSPKWVKTNAAPFAESYNNPAQVEKLYDISNLARDIVVAGKKLLSNFARFFAPASLKPAAGSAASNVASKTASPSTMLDLRAMGSSLARKIKGLIVTLANSEKAKTFYQEYFERRDSEMKKWLNYLMQRKLILASILIVVFIIVKYGKRIVAVILKYGETIFNINEKLEQKIAELRGYIEKISQLNEDINKLNKYINKLNGIISSKNAEIFVKDGQLKECEKALSDYADTFEKIREEVHNVCGEGTNIRDVLTDVLETSGHDKRLVKIISSFGVLVRNLILTLYLKNKYPDPKITEIAQKMPTITDVLEEKPSSKIWANIVDGLAMIQTAIRKHTSEGEYYPAE